MRTKSKVKFTSRDPDIRSSLPALLRAARHARALSKATGTPFYVMRKGKIVDLNAPPAAARKRRKRASRERDK
jgi:hypothetical protein